VKERMKGYNRAMRQAGLEGMAREIVASELPELRGSEVRLAGQYVRVIKNNEYFSKLASQAVEEILSAPTRPTALFVCHDVMAFWMCAMLEARGVSIPDEISVVGFDWIARWDVAIPDTLTTAYQDFAGFGRHAVNLLLDRLNGEAPAESRHVLLDAPLVVRASTTSDLSLPDIDPITPSRAMLPK
jgi:LacI family transcriptional regulator